MVGSELLDVGACLRGFPCLQGRDVLKDVAAGGLGREALLPTRGDSAGSCRERHMAGSGGWASWGFWASFNGF